MAHHLFPVPRGPDNDHDDDNFTNCNIVKTHAHECLEQRLGQQFYDLVCAHTSCKQKLAAQSKFMKSDLLEGVQYLNLVWSSPPQCWSPSRKSWNLPFQKPNRNLSTGCELGSGIHAESRVAKDG